MVSEQIFVINELFQKAKQSPYNARTYTKATPKLCNALSDNFLLIDKFNSFKNILTTHLLLLLHSEKNPARPMLFYSTNYWQQF